MLTLGLVLSMFTPALPGAECAASAAYQAQTLHGTLDAGDTFQARFGDHYTFILAPSRFGWVIRVEQRGRRENLARLTPPWHVVPNPRALDGWHFRNAANSGPNDGSVNAPQATRVFFFSPEVGRSLHYSGSATSTHVVDAVRSFGRGELVLSDYRLTPPREGDRASFEHIDFDVCLVWRREE